MLELTELKRLHDKAFNSGQTTRENASADNVFYWITHWDGNLLEDVNLLYRGQFDVLRKAGRQILSSLKSNPVQVDFDPVDSDRDDGAELLDGLYRADDRVNTSLEAYDMASQDSVVCGVGAWELYTKYKNRKTGNNDQVIRRRYIPEAVNTVFWDSNAKRLDKSDATYCSVLTAYSEDGYKDLIEEMTGERPDTIDMGSFKHPEISYSFPWVGGESKKIYVVNFYYRVLVTETILIFKDPFGMTSEYVESELSAVMDDLIDSGHEIVGEKEIKRWEVTKYIASGAEIIKHDVIAGENIPVVPVYGERAIIEGEEHYEGITRLAKDPQQLRNFGMSYLADMLSKSPRAKPIFLQEQIAGFESMYDVSGAENDYPYLLQNYVDAQGDKLPIGPVAQMPDPPMPAVLGTVLDLSRQAVSDVADPGLPQDIADPDLSGKAVIALQNRVDEQSYVYLHHLKFAKRRDGEIYASMASQIYDAPREVTVAKADGTTSKSLVMNSIIDSDTGDLVILNDLTNMEFDVFADIGPAYASQKEETIETLSGMADSTAVTDPPLSKALMLKTLEMIDGVNLKDIREYARKQLVLTGFSEPETPEEEELLAQAQQNEDPDPMMVAAQAEAMKAQADNIKAESDREIGAATIQINTHKAETDRAKVMIAAEEAGVNIQLTQAKVKGQRIDNMSKVTDIHDKQFDRYRGRLTG